MRDGRSFRPARPPVFVRASTTRKRSRGRARVSSGIPLSLRAPRAIPHPLEQMKLTVIGAGNVGATVAECVARMDIVEHIALIDINAGVAKGKALDLMQTAPIHGFDTVIEGGDDYALTAGSDITVITAGLPRKPGMSRDDLLKVNADIVSSASRARSSSSRRTRSSSSSRTRST